MEAIVSDDDDELMATIKEVAESLGMSVGPVITPTPERQQAAADRLALAEMAINEASGNVPRSIVEFNPLSRQNGNRWSDQQQDDPLWLLTPAEFDLLPDGTVLVGIGGQTKVKGAEYIDQDTRYGFIAWGLLDSQLPPVAAQ
jgi:hypothetical protein